VPQDKKGSTETRTKEHHKESGEPVAVFNLERQVLKLNFVLLTNPVDQKKIFLDCYITKLTSPGMPP